jgi:hypothetical protein
MAECATLSCRGRCSLAAMYDNILLVTNDNQVDRSANVTLRIHPWVTHFIKSNRGTLESAGGEREKERRRGERT